MVKIAELSTMDRKRMVSDISRTMYGYHIDKDSIKDFWDTVEIGIEAKWRA